MAERVTSDRARGRLRPPPGSERAQAQIELLASLPVLVAAGAVVLQLLAVGYAQSLADSAAEAGALAVAAGRPSQAAAFAAVPGWAEDRTSVESEGGRVSVQLRPPVLIPGLGRSLEVQARAWARPPAEDAGP